MDRFFADAARRISNLVNSVNSKLRSFTDEHNRRSGPSIADHAEHEIDLASKVVAVVLAAIVVAWLVAFAVLLIMYGDGPHG
jgi:hypothetical protein